MEANQKIIGDAAAAAVTTSTATGIIDQQEDDSLQRTTNAKQVSFTSRDNSPAHGSIAEGGVVDQAAHQQGGDHHVDGNVGVGGVTPHPQQHGHHHHHHHRHARSLSDQMPWYTPPMQRQRWGEEQLAPHTEWGDIFFDLFYVASAYNLGNVLREDPTAQGLLYLCGCFLPLMNLWTFKMYFDARYLVQGDVFHQCFDMTILLALATAALHIRPVAILSNPHDNFDMFAFSCSVCMATLLHLGRLMEIAVCQGFFQTKGLYPEAFFAVRHEALYEIPSVLFYVVAVIYSAIQYFGQHDNDGGGETAHGASYPSDEYAKDGNASSSTGSHRSLASGETPSYSQDSPKVQDDVAIWLLLAGFVIGILMMVLDIFCFKKADHKKTTVPMNIGYAIHRYGEFVMLLLGESVLSLLIVDLNEGYEYYQTFFAGVITVILMQYLHFQSHSHDPDKHAMRRSVFSGISYYMLMFVYAPALIILGTCYKMFMFEFEYEEEGYNDVPEESSSSHGRMLFQALLFAPQQRSLAGGTSAALRFSKQERQERIADFFSGSLACIWLCLDLMILAHKGLKENLARSRESSKLRFGAFAMVCLRVGLILFAATLSQYISDPTTLSFLGMAGMIGQLLLRACGTFFLPPDEQDQEEQEAEALDRMAGYVAARLRDPKQSYHDS